MAIRLHHYKADTARYTHELAFEGPYAVVCGITTAGQMVLPASDKPEYVVPCGVHGVPYFAGFAEESGRCQLFFQDQLDHLVIASTSEMAPTFLAKPVPPPVTVKSVAYLGFAEFTTDKVYQLSYTDGSVSNWKRGKRQPAPPVGILQYQEGNYGLYEYSGNVLATDPFPNLN